MTPMATCALPNARHAVVNSASLGSIEYTQDDVIQFPDGLVGFPECREFLLVHSAREGMLWLQSTEFEALTFLLADPFRFFDGYSVDIPEVELRMLKARVPSDLAVLVIVTLPAESGDPFTANLQGPLALNLSAGRGRQVILAGATHGVRRPFRLEDAPAS